jgi:hypothetical protein
MADAPMGTLEQSWIKAVETIENEWAAAGIPENMWPHQPDNWERPGHMSPAVWLARRRRETRMKARQAAVLKQLRGREEADPWWQNPDMLRLLGPQAMLAMGQLGVANAQAQGIQGAGFWNAMGENPALFGQMQRAQMGPMADFFWNQFPQQMNQIGDTIGEQLNLNADRINRTNLAASEAAVRERMQKRQLAALEKIMGGFSGALSDGLGGLGNALGGGGGFNPLGASKGWLSAAGGMRILPDGTVATVQNIDDPRVAAGKIAPGGLEMALRGVNAKANADLQRMANRGIKSGANLFNQRFRNKAARENIGARNNQIAQLDASNRAQLATGLAAKKGEARNILTDATTKARVQAANNKMRVAYSSLIPKLAGAVMGGIS